MPFLFCILSFNEYYAAMVDSVFQHISRNDATTGILYNRVLPFSGFNKGYCNVCQKDTANADMFYQAYMEMYNASFISTNALPFNNESLEYLANQNINIVNIGFLHFKYNLFNDSVAMQKLYFDADSIVREDTNNHNSLYQEMTPLMISPLINKTPTQNVAFSFNNLFILITQAIQ